MNCKCKQFNVIADKSLEQTLNLKKNSKREGEKSEQKKSIVNLASLLSATVIIESVTDVLIFCGLFCAACHMYYSPYMPHIWPTKFIYILIFHCLCIHGWFYSLIVFFILSPLFFRLKNIVSPFNFLLSLSLSLVFIKRCSQFVLCGLEYRTSSMSKWLHFCLLVHWVVH